MSKLFISNTTKQNYQFRYRTEKEGQVRRVDIPYGQQIKIDQDLTKEQIDFILKQHTGDSHEYMVAEKDIDLTAGHIGLVYSIDKPVNAEKSATVIDENDGELDRQSAKLRKDTMSVIAANLSKTSGKAPAVLTSDIIQETKTDAAKDGIAERIEVDSGAARR